MVYIGIPISIEETVRLTSDWIYNQNENPDAISDIQHLNTILKKFTNLKLFWIDKNQTIFGYDVETLTGRFWLPLLSVDDAILQILETKRKFKNEVNRLNLDLTNVTFCHMEEEDSIAYNPEPMFFA